MRENSLFPAVIALVFIAIAVFIYIYKRSLLIGFISTGGGIPAILFRPSVIEGKKIDATAAEEVTEVIQWLVDTKN